MNSTRNSLIFLTLVALVAGCGTSQHGPTSPVATDARGSSMAGAATTTGARADMAGGWSHFYPLAIGHTSHSVRTGSVTWQFADGSPAERDTWGDKLFRQVVGEVVLNGVTYREELTVWPNDVPYVTSVLYRQTADGLFEADGLLTTSTALAAASAGRTAVPLADAVGRESDAAAERIAARLPAAQRAACARAYASLRTRIAAMEVGFGVRDGWRGRGPRLPLPPDGELARLRYPLRAGAQWIIRADPSFTSRVEGVEMVSRLGLPAVPGWRIRDASELYGPNDRVRQWYGTDGLLKSVYHTEAVATDEGGNVVGTMIYDSTELQSAE